MKIDDLNARSGVVVNPAMRVHSALGPGLLESAYKACLIYELRGSGFRVQTEVVLPVFIEACASTPAIEWIS